MPTFLGNEVIFTETIIFCFGKKSEINQINNKTSSVDFTVAVTEIYISFQIGMFLICK